MWTTAVSFILLVILLGLVISQTFVLIELRRGVPSSSSSSSSSCLPTVVEQKLAAVETVIAQDRLTAYTVTDTQEALIAAERILAAYSILKQLGLPYDAVQESNTIKLIHDIRNAGTMKLDDDRQFHALT